MKRPHRFGRWAAALTAFVLLPSNGHAQDDFAEQLTGDWGGARSALLERGVSIDVVNTTDLFASIDGGLSDDSSLTNLFELALSADLEALFGLRGGALYFHGLGVHGDDPAESSGTAHAPSNLAADSSWYVLELWYEQSLLQQRLGLLAGLYAVDSEFDAKETADVFLNGGLGLGLDLSETGINGPSVFPITGLGLRARFQFTPALGLRAALTEGIPGDPDDPTAFRIDLDDGGGSFLIAEADWQPDGFEFLRLGLGAWRYSSSFERLDGAGQKSGTNGAYAFVEGILFTRSGTNDQGLSGFLRVGRADEAVNRFAAYQGAGLVYTGLFPGRDADVLGLGVSSVVNGDDFVDSVRAAGGHIQRRETVLELTYRAQVLPWLSIQPSVQYAINPDTDPDIDNHLSVALRLGISF